MRIVVDIDDVLNELCKCWVETLNERYNCFVRHEDITDWNIKRFFPELTEQEVYGVLLDENFWKTVTPKQDAMQYMMKLYQDEYDIYLCTSTHYNNIKVKFENIVQKYYPFISWEKVIIAHNKQMIRTDVMVDDAVHNLIDGEYYKILMSAPHNANCNVEEYGIHRANNWQEVYEMIERIRNEETL